MRLKQFFHDIQQDLKLFFFVLLLLCLYRAIFLWVFSGYMDSSVAMGDVALANLTGLRLSLKTAGWVAAPAFLFCTLGTLLMPRGRSLFAHLRLLLGGLSSLVFTILFFARFPYYATFHTTYSLQVVAGANDDIGAIFSMLVAEYGLVWRLGLAILLAAALTLVLRALFRAGTAALPRVFAGHPLRFLPCFLVCFTLFFLFARFGGALSYSGGVNWENAGVTRDDFLNECILDDGQALYRAYEMNKSLKAGNIYGVEKDSVREMARLAAGHAKESGDDLATYLARTTKGPRMAKPKHIFIVLGESWARWPMLDKYAGLHIADGIKGLAASPRGYESRAFMPNGEFTSVALTGIITGLSDVAINVNYEPQSLKEVYPTAFAPQLKKLGYHVDFWYGGTPSWDGIKRLALAQGFDDYYGYPDFNGPKQNTWGTTDGELFKAISAHLSEEPPTVHVIMTVSNHPPYNLDLEGEGLDLAALKERVRQMEDVKDPDTLAVELGHYWYMDKVVTDFVKRTEAEYPDSLFILTGDHAVRTNPSQHPTIYEEQSVPFVLYGAGVTKDILPEDTAGGLTNVLPTLMELLAPAGCSYTSIVPPLTEEPDGMGAGFNRSTWVTRNAVGRVGTDTAEALPWNDSFDVNAEQEKADRWLKIARTLSWQLIRYGSAIGHDGDSLTRPPS